MHCTDDIATVILQYYHYSTPTAMNILHSRYSYSTPTVVSTTTATVISQLNVDTAVQQNNVDAIISRYRAFLATRNTHSSLEKLCLSPQQPRRQHSATLLYLRRLPPPHGALSG